MIKKIVVIGYLIAALVLSLYSTGTESQPALFWIDLFAPNAGDQYDMKIVFLLTFLCCMLPLVVMMGLGILFQNRRTVAPASPDESGVWITRKKQFQSALMSIPVYNHQTKVGTVNMGQKIFFGVSSINLSIQAGQGKEQSIPFEHELTPGEQLHLELEVVPEGLFTRYVLRQIPA